LRYFELGTVYRFEKSGVLHGLTRVRGFTQDDAHIFCTPDQLSEELVSILKLGLGILKEFGFKDYDVYLSTRPEKYVGTPGNWKKATSSLKYALEKVGLKYQVDPGEGVFYGPKIDIKIKDSLGRAWQCTTLQVDFNVPERMQVTYIDQKGKKQQPIMIHRALVGSLERFIGVLLEHYAGALPLWLSPEQIWVVPIGEGHRKYAREIAGKIESAGFRVKVKEENETMGRKIREGEIQKIPYILIVGDEEIKNETVGVRKRGKGNTGAAKLEKFLKDASLELENKA
jgi:threonyl-tRNA synthetase